MTRKVLIQHIAQLRADRNEINRIVTKYEQQIVLLNAEKAEKQDVHDALVLIATTDELKELEVKEAVPE